MNARIAFLLVAACVATTPVAVAAPPASAAAAAAVDAAEPAVNTSAPASPAPKAPPAGRTVAGAVDRLALDRTQITGNGELPKVMVVVPWKKADIGELVGRPLNSLVDEALQPVDRDVFRREISYYGALAAARPGDEKQVTAAPRNGQPEK